MLSFITAGGGGSLEGCSGPRYYCRHVTRLNSLSLCHRPGGPALFLRAAGCELRVRPTRWAFRATDCVLQGCWEEEQGEGAGRASGLGRWHPGFTCNLSGPPDPQHLLTFTSSSRLVFALPLLLSLFLSASPFLPRTCELRLFATCTLLSCSDHVSSWAGVLGSFLSVL